jgi:hypothetical protein
MVKTKRSGNTVRYFTLAAVVAIGALLAPAQVIAQGTDPGHDGAENVRLVGYHDMQGRQALQLTAKSDPTNGNWLYVGYQPNARPEYDGSPEPQMNSITGKARSTGPGSSTSPTRRSRAWCGTFLATPVQTTARYRSSTITSTTGPGTIT